VFLTCCNFNIFSLDVEDISSLTNLKLLNLNNNQITDVTPLAALTQLEYLVLSDNPISQEDKDWLVENLPDTFIEF